MIGNTIVVRIGQPFGSRVGVDDLLLLSFSYDPTVVKMLKEIFEQERQRGRYPKTANGHLRTHPGGWLRDQKAWFCEREAWPPVYAALLNSGFTFQFEPPASPPSVLEWPIDGSPEAPLRVSWN